MWPNPVTFWSHLLNKSLMENFIFCALLYVLGEITESHEMLPLNIYSSPTTLTYCLESSIDRWCRVSWHVLIFSWFRIFQIFSSCKIAIKHNSISFLQKWKFVHIRCYYCCRVTSPFMILAFCHTHPKKTPTKSDFGVVDRRNKFEGFWFDPF